jgi:hypothetical protein
LDTISAILNTGAVILIRYVKPEDFLDNSKKDYIDYFMIVVLCISWLRFFVYFLVIKPLSKLMLTLIAMIVDTLSFMFIIGCFIMIMASVYTTLF